MLNRGLCSLMRLFSSSRDCASEGTTMESMSLTNRSKALCLGFCSALVVK